MTHPDAPPITHWHAHVYFDASSRDAALAFRERVAANLDGLVAIGRFHERPVGPHPLWSFQITITPAHFAEVVAWLTFNHGALDVLLHPNTSDALRDHRDCAVWIGHSHPLNLQALG